MRTAGSRAFRLADGIWTDTAFDPAQGTTKVPFLSEAYFALAAVHPDLAVALGSGGTGHRGLGRHGLRGGGRRRSRRYDFVVPPATTTTAVAPRGPRQPPWRPGAADGGLPVAAIAGLAAGAALVALGGTALLVRRRRASAGH